MIKRIRFEIRRVWITNKVQAHLLILQYQFLKAQLKGENFANLSALKAQIQQLLDALLPDQVASLTGYDFILEAVFYAAM